MSRENEKMSIGTGDVKDGAIKGVKGIKKLLQEFKEFAMRGNMIDMAVGIVIGSAFTGMVNSIVTNFMELVGYLIGDNASDYEGLRWHTVEYGQTISAIVNFIILAAIVFVVVKAMNALAGIAKKNKEEETAAVEATELKVLEEIRDMLKEEKNIKS